MIRVTDALKLVGLVDTSFMTEHGAARGTAVHAATALSDAGNLDEATIHAEVAPRLASWRRWVKESGFLVEHTEMEVRSVTLDYAGQLDRVGTFNGKDLVLLDLKNGSPDTWHRLQTALYAIAFAEEHKTAIPRRGCVYLTPADRAASFVEHKDRTDLAIARHLIALANWRVQNP